MRAGRILRERGMSHTLLLNQHRILASKKLRDILCVLQRSDGVNLSIEQLISYRRARKTDGGGGGPTEFPMTKTRLLKVLRSKVGKASTERTGHLGIIGLILTVQVSE